MNHGYSFYKPSSDEDYTQLYRVMDTAFKDEDVASIVRNFVENYPEMTGDNYFMIKHDNEAVAGLLLIPQTWCIGGVEFKVAEMGCVGTAPMHRQRGLQRILNARYDEYAKESGYDLCVLAGIPYFYREFGYQYAVELDYLTEIKIRKIPDGPRLETRQFSEDDIEQAMSLLESTQKRYMVHSNRTKTIWKTQLKTGIYGAEPFKSIAVFEDSRLISYYRYQYLEEEKTYVIRELAQVTPQYVPRVAATIKIKAEELGADKIKTKLSHTDHFSQYLKKLGAKMNTPYAWQVKILNPVNFLRKLGPVLENRLEGSKFKGLSKVLKFNFWKYGISLSFEDGKLLDVKETTEASRNIGLNPYASIQLFMGYRSRVDLQYAYQDFIIRDEYEELIDVLFPRKPGYIHYCY